MKPRAVRLRSNPRLVPLEARAIPATFTVTTAADAGAGSLRQAILDANAATVDPLDTIAFQIGTGVVVIQPAAPLPAITGATTVDGTTQPGFAGKPIVVLDGVNAGVGAPGLQVNAGDVTIKALVIHQFQSDGIQGFGAISKVTIRGCYVGTDVAGTADKGNGGSGIAIFNNGGAPDTVTLGGPNAADRNVISGNEGQGIYLGSSTGAGVTNVIVENNYIGTDVSGAAKIGNTGSGLRVDNTGSVTARKNLVSGNGGDGIAISGTGSVIEANVCGLAADGKTPLGNSLSGIALFGGASQNFVGGSDETLRNVVSGNGTGLYCGNPTTVDNTFQFNYVGTDVTGLLPAGNSFRGVWIDNAAINRVSFCVVCASANDGVVISGPDAKFNRVRNSLIGVGSDTMTVIGNKAGGVNIFGGAQFNLIGSGPKDPGPNVISGNVSFGVGIFDPGTSENFVQGNYIGTDLFEFLALGNGGAGVAIDNGATNNQVRSGDGPNVIAFNVGDGVSVSSAAATGNLINFNSIHSNGGLGIDLGDNGVTTNDSKDPDTGPANFQNYPVLTFAQAGPTTKVSGTFNSTPGTQFTLQFYASNSADPSGFGEGQRALGSATVTTDAQGDAVFNNVTFPFAFTLPGDAITVVAIDPANNTSEFSKALAAQGPTTPPCVENNTVLVNFGAAQRSRVTDILVTFDQVVNLPSSPETAFELKRQSDGANVGLTATTDSSTGQTVVFLNFTGPNVTAGSLNDGRYTLRGLASKISNANGPLDGNCDGTAGDDFVLVGSPATAPKLFRLFGDADGSGTVDALDFSAFRQAFGTAAVGIFDYDGSGSVDVLDFGQFRQRFGNPI